MRPSDTVRVKIYTRSLSKRLYERAMSYVTLPFPKERLVGTSPDGYLYAVIADESADWVINIDEDAFVTSNEHVLDLLDHMIEQGYGNAGMPDGGVVSHRTFNPVVTNPFFQIMHTAELRRLLDREAVAAFDVTDPAHEQAVPQALMRHPWTLEPSYEPHYQLLMWITSQVKTLYLDARDHADGITTELLDHLGRPIVLHTWYSREYGQDAAHTDRIHAVADEAHRLSGAGHATTRLEKLRERGKQLEYKAAIRLHIWLKRRYDLEDTAPGQ